MSIFKYLKESLEEGIGPKSDDMTKKFLSQEKGANHEEVKKAGEKAAEEFLEEEQSFEGDPKALVDAMIENAPGAKEQIGVILKYAANSIPDYDIWDAALDYYESIGDEGTGDDEVAPEEEPMEEPIDEPTEEPTEEEPLEEPSEEPVEDEEEVEVSDEEELTM